MMVNGFYESRVVVVAFECHYMKLGLKSIIDKMADEFRINVRYIDFDVKNSLLQLINVCKENAGAIVLCDVRDKLFTYCFTFFSNCHLSTVSSITLLDTDIFNESERPHNYIQSDLSILNRQENQIIRLLMNAWKPKQIAEVTGISIGMISFHKRNAMKKLGVRTLCGLFHKYHGSSRDKNIAILSNPIFGDANSHSCTSGME